MKDFKRYLGALWAVIRFGGSIWQPCKGLEVVVSFLALKEPRTGQLQSVLWSCACVLSLPSRCTLLAAAFKELEIHISP